MAQRPQAVADAVARYPQLAHLEAEFSAWFTGQQADGTLDAAGLLLCWAAARGELSAVKRLDELVVVQTRKVTAGMPEVASHADDICQRVRERLFAPRPDGKSGLTQFSGKGPLETWLRTAAVREAIRITDRSGDKPQTRAREEELAQLPALDADPELRFLKTHYGAHFRAAFKEAVAKLEPGKRTLLKLNYVDGMSIDRLAQVLDVHRATAARRLASARAELLEGLRGSLMSTLGLGDAELDSLLRLIDGNLSISLSVLMVEDP